ncbi:hypothetical protein VIGAN_10006000 [Vigna angularis var. angularis]|uniref:Uncharacterized protein n=1 Tax=Vigna angularis var. angularis TaxID=157739 RepID=A0A0S3T1B2_PHAAN|nr:hypothetical protein VIGAN_10006000 [Vigna angularis var. angularis]
MVETAEVLVCRKEGSICVDMSENDHLSLRYPEVSVRDLPKHQFMRWEKKMDLLDWLYLLFGFQIDNSKPEGAPSSL